HLCEDSACRIRQGCLTLENGFVGSDRSRKLLKTKAILVLNRPHRCKNCMELVDGFRSDDFDRLRHCIAAFGHQVDELAISQLLAYFSAAFLPSSYERKYQNWTAATVGAAFGQQVHRNDRLFAVWLRVNEAKMARQGSATECRFPYMEGHQ
ncbi:MAG: hypothetical protein ACK5X5_12765, partial [bacterium]